jgi:hypothetical protein
MSRNSGVASSNNYAINGSTATNKAAPVMGSGVAVTAQHAVVASESKALADELFALLQSEESSNGVSEMVLKQIHGMILHLYAPFLHIDHSFVCVT